LLVGDLYNGVFSWEVGDVPGFSPGDIFISYRREDAAPYALLLKVQLSEQFSDARVFMDMDSIDPGLDFAEVIQQAVGSCAVLVALIGRQWATLTDEEGQRRIDDPDDLVRFEVQAALERGVRVIPVLVDGARPLKRQQLPAELQKLARLNALELTYGRYEYDAGQLLKLIQRVLAAPPETAAAPIHAGGHDAQPDEDAISEAIQTGPEAARAAAQHPAQAEADIAASARESGNPSSNHLEALALTAYEAERAAHPRSLPGWDDITEQEKQAWRVAVSNVGQTGEDLAEAVPTDSLLSQDSLLIQVEDQRYSFHSGFTAGRQGTLVINDISASGHHARFTAAHGFWYVEDLGSVNGTWLNGRRIHASLRLKKGDKIRIGHTVMTVVSVSA